MSKAVISKKVTIPAPKFQAIRFVLTGTSAYVQTPRGRNGPYASPEGWHGVPAAGLTMAIRVAARILHMQGQWQRQTVFVIPDDYDASDGMGLARITKGKPVLFSELKVEVEGWEKRAHAFNKGWQGELVVSFDADVWKPQEIVKLVSVTGREVGIGAYRPERGGEYGSFSVSVK